jgi:hypothetical protein
MSHWDKKGSATVVTPDHIGTREGHKRYRTTANGNDVF